MQPENRGSRVAPQRIIPVKRFENAPDPSHMRCVQLAGIVAEEEPPGAIVDETRRDIRRSGRGREILAGTPVRFAPEPTWSRQEPVPAIPESASRSVSISSPVL